MENKKNLFKILIVFKVKCAVVYTFEGENALDLNII